MKYVVIMLVFMLCLTGCRINQNDNIAQVDEKLQKDLFDGDNVFLSITPGKTEIDDALDIAKTISTAETDRIDWQGERPGLERFDVVYDESGIEVITFSVENGIVIGTQIGFRKPISLQMMIEYFGNDMKLSALSVGLHESQIAIKLFYPQEGIIGVMNFLEAENPILNPDSEINSIIFIEAQSKLIPTNFYFVIEHDIQCSRDWRGYGNVFELYYPDATGTTCPYTSP